MGFNNPDQPWSEIERRLSGRPAGPAGGVPDGGDAPAWSHHRSAYEKPAGLVRTRGAVPYAELHCHSNFSFLDGASPPEQLAEEAARLGLDALAITDHDGFYGVVRFAEAARTTGLPTVFGAELSIGLTEPQNGVPDPEGHHLLVLARGPAGYARLASTISDAQLAGQEKGKPVYDGIDFSTAHGGDWLVLTGCRKGAVPKALVERGPAAAQRELHRMVDTFGAGNVLVELWDHHDPLDSARNDALAQIAHRVGVEVVATNNVHYATPAERQLATALAAVRARRSLDDADGWLPPAATAHLRSGAEQARRFARYPGAVERAAEYAAACAFDLKLVAPELPPYPCPDGLTEMQFLRRVVEEGATRRYGRRTAERIPGAWDQIDHELALIEQLNFPGYFLIVWDLVEFCRKADIYCQGRGSAANSAVCYALGITKADAVALGLLFERFLSPERDGPPDIDIDIESGRREEVIQYVYERHGRRHAAQVANVITYRSRSSIRDMAKALGYDVGQQDAFSKSVDGWSGVPAQQGPQANGDPGGFVDGDGEGRRGAEVEGGRAAGLTRSAAQRASQEGSARLSTGTEASASVARTAPPEGKNGVYKPDVPDDVLALAAQVEHFPRHLGVHSGGMVMCDRPVVEVCPVEWARFSGRENSSWPKIARQLDLNPQQPIRTVLQWDKDDCAAAGLVKFDLLGLGMLSTLHYSIDMIAETHGVEVDLAAIPQDDRVYEMLGHADSVGVFQVESRAQMATLPRLKPRNFYDLVVEVALIRPGPIQGGSVHPYIRRRNGEEEVTFLHPLLEKSLAKTLGIPLFQEQLMQMAIDVAGFTPSESDQLRQAMGSKRSRERMERLHQRFTDGARARDVPDDVIDEIWVKLASFANYGFPESHSVSFAYLVYASSWIKRFYPAAFCAGLLNAQPMGFWSPHTLIQDARRHGVEVRTPDLNASAAKATLESGSCMQDELLEVGTSYENGPPETWGVGGPAVRLGIGSVRHIGEDVAERIAAGRPYESMEDLHRRIGLTLPQLEALATAGAFECLGLDRREALWQAGAVAQGGASRLPGIVTGATAPPLPGMDDFEVARSDLWATGMSPDGHPTKFIRDQLDSMGVVPSSGLAALDDRAKVLVAGVVTHRQRPATAGGTLFLNLEDEFGLINIVVSKGCWTAHRRVALTAPAMVIRGRLEKTGEVINVVAEKLSTLPVRAPVVSRDFR